MSDFYSDGDEPVFLPDDCLFDDLEADPIEDDNVREGLGYGADDHDIYGDVDNKVDFSVATFLAYRSDGTTHLTTHDDLTPTRNTETAA